MVTSDDDEEAADAAEDEAYDAEEAECGVAMAALPTEAEPLVDAGVGVGVIEGLVRRCRLWIPSTVPCPPVHVRAP